MFTVGRYGKYETSLRQAYYGRNVFSLFSIVSAGTVIHLRILVPGQDAVKSKGVSAMRKRLSLALLFLLSIFTSSAQAGTEAILDVTPLYQADYTTVLFTYHGEDKTVADIGCSVACLAMAMNYLEETDAYDPEALLLEAYENELYNGAGINYNNMVTMLENHGFAGQWFCGSVKLFRRALRHGCPIVAFMGSGYFTNNGHYILIIGIDQYDRLIVVDPNSERNSQGLYKTSIILREANSEGSFMVCYRIGDTPLAKVQE